MTTGLDGLLGHDRTWTAAQLATALGDQGIAFPPARPANISGNWARWPRTVRTLRHKQDPERVEQATVELADLKNRPRLATSA